MTNAVKHEHAEAIGYRILCVMHSGIRWAHWRNMRSGWWCIVRRMAFVQVAGHEFCKCVAMGYGEEEFWVEFAYNYVLQSVQKWWQRYATVSCSVSGVGGVAQIVFVQRWGRWGCVLVQSVS